MKKTVKLNPEFGIELVIGVPYVKYLHDKGLLEKVITSEGMAPFYFFTDLVEESITFRTIDNTLAGLNETPNPWIHHNAMSITGKAYGDLTEEEQTYVNGMLDYREWSSVNYKEHYKDNDIDLGNKPLVFVSNIFNHPYPNDKRHYHHFNMQCLVDMFTILTEKNYTVIYKRPTNKERGITIDQNEQGVKTLKALTEDGTVITDHDLARLFPNVILFDDLLEKYLETDYNTLQLQVMSKCDRFISVCGGNGILSSCFGGDVIIYVTQGKELRKGYFDENSYFRKLSNANIIPIFDRIDEILKRGSNDYTELIETIKQKL